MRYNNNIQVFIKDKETYELLKPTFKDHIRFIHSDENEVIKEIPSKYDLGIDSNYIEKKRQMLKEHYLHNYDFFYLKTALEYSINEAVSNIFVGLSYSQAGVNIEELGDISNLSMGSQDLFYSFELLKRVCEKNKNLKNIYIGLSYYALFFDLSKTTNEIFRIKNLYYPILQESHNLEMDHITTNTNIPIFSKIDNMLFNCVKLEYNLRKKIYTQNKEYYNEINIRKSKVLNQDFNKLSKGEKFKLGKIRADQHNKLIKYLDTYNENKNILKEGMEYLSKKEININIVIFPTTDYYRYNLDKKYKNKFYEVIDELLDDYKFKVIDLENESKLFKDNDFMDFDHLNEQGAVKASRLINSKTGKI